MPHTHGHAHGGHEHEHNKHVHIEVNGRDKEVHGSKISYEHIVTLAYPEFPNSECTVTYTSPTEPDGSLAKGQEVHLHEGMKFYATKTNRS